MNYLICIGCFIFFVLLLTYIYNSKSCNEKFGFYYPLQNDKRNNKWHQKLQYYNEAYGWAPYDFRYNNPVRRFVRPAIYQKPYGKGRWISHFGKYYYAY